MSTSSMTRARQLAINLYNGVCGALHAIGGTHCPSNILPPHVCAPTALTKGDHIKFLITDERILESLMRSVKRQR